MIRCGEKKLIYELEENIEADIDFSPQYLTLEGGYGKDSMPSTDMEKANNVDHLKQLSSGKPPRHLSILHMSTVKFLAAADADLDSEIHEIKLPPNGKSEFLPMFRSGSCAERGPKQYIEDEHLCIDNLVEYLGPTACIPSAGAFYGVFDGHGGIDAASFAKTNLLNFIVEDSHFPACVHKAVRSAFVRADYAFADDSSLDISAGTTALTALIFGRKMLIANSGDCRAVLGRRGRAIELSKDHKPNCPSERWRIEELGGAIYDGYLNGQLSVARALGDWHMKGPKGSACPLTAEPELQERLLTEEDEFLIMGCDGLWDVMSSQFAVSMARRELMLHNDPERCSRELVREALRRNTCDNLTVVVICFTADAPPRLEVPQSRFRRSISAEGLNFLKGFLDSS